jgi:hypothetical protein
VSINLVEKRIAAFDQTGLKIADLPWPDDLMGGDTQERPR